MSRLPLNEIPVEQQTPPELVLMVESLQDAPITARQIAHWTALDPLLSKVCQYIRDGWPETRNKEELSPFWSRRLHFVGRESGGSVTGSRFRTRRVAWRASGCVEDDGIGEGVGLVARVRWWGGGGGKELCGVPAGSVTACCRVVDTMELAESSMVQNPPGLRWPNGGEDVF